MKEVAQEPATLVEPLETIPDGVDPEAYKVVWSTTKLKV